MEAQKRLKKAGSLFPFFALVASLLPLSDGRMGATVERAQRVKAAITALQEFNPEVAKHV